MLSISFLYSSFQYYEVQLTLLAWVDLLFKSDVTSLLKHAKTCKNADTLLKSLLSKKLIALL